MKNERAERIMMRSDEKRNTREVKKRQIEIRRRRKKIEMRRRRKKIEMMKRRKKREMRKESGKRSSVWWRPWAS